MHVVLVEDDQILARGLCAALSDLGHGVDWLADGHEGEAHLLAVPADLAIIDINLPGQSGLDLVRALRRAAKAIPVLVLTARAETVQRVEGLEAGADDDLVKPFEMTELSARLRALLRRRPPAQPATEQIGTLLYTPGQRTLRGPGGEIALPRRELPRRELALFECLLDHRDHIVSRDTIADRLYGSGADVESNAIEVLVSRLRRKCPGTGLRITTARGPGYLRGEDPR